MNFGNTEQRSSLSCPASSFFPLYSLSPFIAFSVLLSLCASKMERNCTAAPFFAYRFFKADTPSRLILCK